MKKYAYYLALLSLTMIATACSKGGEDNRNSDETVEISGIKPLMGSIESAGAGSRAQVTGYAVNTAADTTFADVMTRTGWSLDLKIYKSGVIFDQGTGIFLWDTGEQMWVYSGTGDRFFPNYLRQNVTARLYPPGWTAVAIDQDSKEKLIGQDILIQNGLPYLQVAPAHIPQIRMQHANSMLNFAVQGVSADDIASLVVVAGEVTYTPLRLPVATVAGNTEYQLILPTGITDPVVRLTTQGGAVYTQIVKIPSTVVNTCYCFTMRGVQLELTAVTVSDWEIGEGIPGEYSAITTYPTFRGRASDYAILYYDNGVSQRLNFTGNGEITSKPDGRTIVRIENADGILELNNTTPAKAPIVLRSMYVDLRPYLDRIPEP